MPSDEQDNEQSESDTVSKDEKDGEEGRSEIESPAAVCEKFTLHTFVTELYIIFFNNLLLGFCAQNLQNINFTLNCNFIMNIETSISPAGIFNFTF